MTGNCVHKMYVLCWEEAGNCFQPTANNPRSLYNSSSCRVSYRFLQIKTSKITPHLAEHRTGCSGACGVTGLLRPGRSQWPVVASSAGGLVLFSLSFAVASQKAVSSRCRSALSNLSGVCRVRAGRCRLLIVSHPFATK